ncbi:DUF952 domain-containing protein [Marivibrio halodurans]|uniref:DUF952 domain-containing protein n=1 Tax=Marivibrio halodurans TaxID=2039722 RepID=A0A8J7RX02_9PROT|nr:DUF952 domain-containing protein [Marivibrio halodurans]MBP5856292.1 DUF952 domain-containing protein [Marivibrio halodurans]
MSTQTFDNRPIYHLAKADAWAQALAERRYEGVAADRADGFLHFSTAEQIAESARRHRAGEPDLMLLTVDPARLDPDTLKWETSRGGKLFPHIYGTVPLEAVVSLDPLPLGADGVHIFPDPLPGLTAG